MANSTGLIARQRSWLMVLAGSAIGFTACSGSDTESGSASGGSDSAHESGGRSPSNGGSDNPQSGGATGGATTVTTGGSLPNAGGSSATGGTSVGGAAGAFGGGSSATGGVGGAAGAGTHGGSPGASGAGGTSGKGGAGNGGQANAGSFGAGGAKSTGGTAGIGGRTAGGAGGKASGGNNSSSGAAGSGGTANCPATGHITYTLSKSASPTQTEQHAYDLISKAMDKALSYYNCYTDISKSIQVSYVPSVQTADGNINGSMRFGSNTTYMDYRTAMHEISHTVGIGTASKWSSLVVNGLFTGTNATTQLQAINATLAAPLYTELHADTQHFWPYGINQQSEVKSEADLLYHMKMVIAIRKDLGL